MLFVEGKHLNYPQLEAETHARMKTFSVNSMKDIAKETIEMFLNDILNLYRNGTIATKLLN